MGEKSYKKFLFIALPATLESLFAIAVTMFDTWMVAPIGTSAISAVVVATQPKLLLGIIFTAFSIAASIEVSKAYGENNRPKANGIMYFTMQISLVLSLALAAVTVILAPEIMKICSGQPDSMEMSITYLRYLMPGLVFQSLMMAMNAALRGLGDTKSTMMSSAAVGIGDVIFNYLLIEGHLGFSPLGIKGSAIATSASFAIGFFISLGFLLKPNCYLYLPYGLKNRFAIRHDDFKDFRRHVFNVFEENFLTRLGFLFSGMIVARLGSFETSMYSVGTQLLSVSYAFGDGVSVALLALVGKCYGAKDKDACKAYIRQGIRVAILFAIVVSLCNISFGETFFASVHRDPHFIETGRMISVFVAVIAPFQICRYARTGVLRGFGNTKKPVRIATISILFVNPPLSYLLAIVLGMKQEGLWIATLISQLVWFLLAEIESRKAIKAFDKESVSE